MVMSENILASKGANFNYLECIFIWKYSFFDNCWIISSLWRLMHMSKKTAPIYDNHLIFFASVTSRVY